jgi:hypothetical protein
LSTRIPLAENVKKLQEIKNFNTQILLRKHKLKVVSIVTRENMYISCMKTFYMLGHCVRAIGSIVADSHKMDRILMSGNFHKSYP